MTDARLVGASENNPLLGSAKPSSLDVAGKMVGKTAEDADGTTPKWTNRVVNVDETIPTRVLEYTPKKFELGVPEAAKAYIEDKRVKPTGFRMAETVRIQTGVDAIEAISVDDAAEAKVLEKLRDIQEGAYKEAYALGLEEGRKEAFTAATAEIDESLKNFNELINAIRKLKLDLLTQNETHLVKVAYHAASRIAGREIEEHPEVVVQILAKALELAQNEEDIKVVVATSQLEFLEKLQKETSREMEFLSKVKMLPSEDIKPGGCIVQTNYGEIDSRVEERVAKLWEEIANSLPRVKEQLSA